MIMILSTVAIFAVAAAAAGDTALRPWRAAGPNDSRGPCPMLNTLANHGYLYVFEFVIGKQS